MPLASSPHQHAHLPGPDLAHDHGHQPTSRARRSGPSRTRRSASPLARGVGTRIVWALGASVGLWLAVWWALS